MPWTLKFFISRDIEIDENSKKLWLTMWTPLALWRSKYWAIAYLLLETKNILGLTEELSVKYPRMILLQPCKLNITALEVSGEGFEKVEKK